MGVETALSVGGLAVGGITSLIGSSMSMKAAYAEASALRTEGDATYYDSLMEAYQVQNEAAQYKEAQAMKYVMSGVSLQGTPMQVLDYTSKQSQLEIDHIKAQGVKAQQLAYTKAAYTESGAKAKLLTSTAENLVSVASKLSSASKGGIFDSSTDSNLDLEVEPVYGEKSIFQNPGLDRYNATRGLS